MSGQALTGKPLLGFYGKFPVRGDFVSRNLPMEFIETWDEWLQSAVLASREQLGESWLETYLTSPLWRFVLSAGLCGNERWAGVMMPSVDRVGRYFPLTIVSTVPSRGRADLLWSADPWFHQIEDLALTVLNDDFDLDTFETSLAQLRLPGPENGRDDDESRPGRKGEIGRTAFQVGMNEPGALPPAFVRLSAMLLEKYLPSYSLWSTEGSQHVESSLIACEGLPPIEVFSSFLNGGWQQRAWNIHTSRATVFELVAPVAEESPTVPCDESGSLSEWNPQSDCVATDIWWTSHGATDVGKKRKINEDALFIGEEQGLWIVADGMGGHMAGDLASKMVTGAFAEFQVSGDVDEAISQIVNQLRQVNRILNLFAAERFSGQFIGSTVAVLTGHGKRCGIVWAGDSRIYRWRAGELVQLTRDHADVDEPDSANLDAGEAQIVEHCNVITRAVGAESVLDLEHEVFDAEDGDTFLLCSDGLIKELSAAEIGKFLSEGSPSECVQCLMALALDRNARDNVTAIVVQANST